jgi:hypothetical protein
VFSSIKYIHKVCLMSSFFLSSFGPYPGCCYKFLFIIVVVTLPQNTKDFCSSFIYFLTLLSIFKILFSIQCNLSNEDLGFQFWKSFTYYSPMCSSVFFLFKLGFELRDSCLLGRCSTTWATLPAYVFTSAPYVRWGSEYLEMSFTSPQFPFNHS